MAAPLLQLKDISKSFPGVKVLDSLSFDLQRGEVHSLCGENGAGKSTLIKLLAGVHGPDSGEIFLEGSPVLVDHPHTAKELGISTIYQENSLFQHLSIAENMFAGQEYSQGGIFYRRKAMVKKTREMLELFELNVSPQTIVGTLGAAQQKIIEILRALITESKILILDEPTASFGREETRQLFKVLDQIKSKGLGIIYISHHLEEVFELSDRITVLRDGNIISTLPKSEASENQVVRDMVGRDAALFYQREDVPIGETVLEVKGLSGNGVRDISFNLHKGEILGIAGIAGAGRTELSELLFGAVPPTSGTITKNGQPLKCQSPRDAIQNGLCLLTEERKLTGLFLHADITNNTCIAELSKSKQKFLAPRSLKKLAREYVQRFKIKTTSVNRAINTLSGGNQQKVILAKWLNTQPDIFIFDEPTRGIDIGAKEDIYHMMVELLHQGKSIIMISSDLPELTALSNRVIVLKRGQMNGHLDRDEISETSVMECAV